MEDLVHCSAKFFEIKSYDIPVLKSIISKLNHAYGELKETPKDQYVTTA